MFCPQCGTQAAPGATTCARCGFAGIPTGTVPPPSPGTLEELVRDAKRISKDLAASSLRLSKRVAEKAEAAAKDPKGTAQKAANRAAKELEKVASEIDRILSNL